jgi:Fe2+ transport system protein FeoA
VNQAIDQTQIEQTQTAQPVTLDQIARGARVRIKRVRGQGMLRRRLMDMGVLPGAEVELLRAAPLGDPLEYKLRGYHLSLRKSEAQSIEVESLL